ncbi:protein CDC73 homolog [Aristolochia californica]|uniref:protein CDC73 homolog n=1 Tax=Aristolochia californica TaxID=171875 RepID=UPI0035D76C9B
MDPLAALRDYATRGELDKIVRVGDEFRFGSDFSFPCNAETAFRSKQGNLYTLETLLFYVHNHQLKHTDYLQATRARKIPAVTLPDRKPLLDYLLGRIASSDSIETLLLPSAKLPGAADQEYRPEEPPTLLAGPAADETEIHVSIANDHVETLNYTSMIKALERPLKDRETLLECRHRNFYEILISSQRREEERHRIESHQRKDGLVAKSRLMGGTDVGGYGEDLGLDPSAKPKMHLKGSKIGEGVPIILVPSASQTLITIYNVKEFLEDGVFVPSDVKMKQLRPGTTKPDCVTVQKKFSRDRVVAAYEVRDKPSTLKAEDWDRVVAVFVLGKEWQFKDWPFKDHVEIFNKIIGFFMRFEDDSVESAKTVKQWNVKIISISKNKRHQDRAAALEVWDRLEEFMRSRSH